MNYIQELNWNSIVNSYKNNDNEETAANEIFKFYRYIETVMALYEKKRKEYLKAQRERKKRLANKDAQRSRT